MRVTAAIIRRSDTILLARRGVGRQLAGYWEFPGGKIELMAYEVRLAEGPIVLNDHDEIQWVPVGELLRYNLAPADVAIAEALAHKSPHEGDVR